MGVQAGRPPGRVPVALGQARGPGTGDRALVRAASPGPRARSQRHPDEHPLARLQVLRRPPAAAARPRGPHDHAQVPRQRRRQGDPGRLRRHLGGEPGRHPPLDHHAGAAGRGRLLRGAGVRRRRPYADHPGRAGDRQHPRAFGRDGQAGPVQHLHALDARPALPCPPRGGRPSEAEAVLLLRRSPPALRRRVGFAPGPDRADRPPHPLEGRWRLLRHPGSHRRAVIGAGPAGEPRPACPARLHARGFQTASRRRSARSR